MDRNVKDAARALHAITFPENGNVKRIANKVAEIAAAHSNIFPKEETALHAMFELLEVAETYFVKSEGKEFDCLISHLRNVGINFHTIDVVMKAVELLHDRGEIKEPRNGYVEGWKQRNHNAQVKADREFFETHIAHNYDDCLFFKHVLGACTMAEMRNVDHGVRVKDFFQNAHLQINEKFGGTYAAAA